MGKSSSLLSSDGNVKDIDTSSGDPQPGSSKSLDIDVDDRNSGMKDLKSECGKSSKSESFLRSDENIENIPTSSGDPKAGSSKDSDTEVRDVDHDRDSRKDLKRKLDNSGSLLSSDGNVKDIDTSSGNPQPGSSTSLDIDVDDRDSGMKKVKYDDDKCSPD
ncbi:unnamed protein product [Lasius platythorax]|uniref:Uncharacterized protein n=1 Tax=Lasius platythorax TaxID=488582 RepID=A0AAV2NWQ8_9HYME